MTSTGQNLDSAPELLPAQKAPVTPEEVWADLMEGNGRFQAGNPAPREFIHRRKSLTAGQRPRVIVLGCSDSRVCPSTLFDQDLGNLFVIRTAGNVADPVALGSIEYAAEVLGAGLLVVLGHENCGAVATAVAGGAVPTANLESIVAKIRPALEKVKGQAEGDEFIRLAERANVRQSARDVLRNSPLLQQKVEAGKLTVIKALYRMSTGQIFRLSE